MRQSCAAAIHSLVGILRGRGKGAARALFRRAPFDERIDPAPQSRNVNVNPIIPPVNGGRIVAKGSALLRGKRGGKQLDVLGLEDLFVVQDEGLVQLAQLFNACQVSLLASERRGPPFEGGGGG